MLNNYSTEALLEFLDYLALKGLMKKATAHSRKAACNNMLSVLDQLESADLRQIDLDDVASRFANLKGSNYAPKSLQVYKSRVSRALSDFLRYRENPANFTVGANARQSSKRRVPNTTLVVDTVQPANPTSKGPTTEFSSFDIPIPLRAGCIIQLNGVPTDLTPTEAKKIANVVVALASEDDS